MICSVHAVGQLLTGPVGIVKWLTLSLAAPFAPPCLEALGLIGLRKKEKKIGFDDVS